MNEEQYIIKRIVSVFKNMNEETLGSILIIDSLKKALTDFGWRYKEDIPNVKGFKIKCLMKNGDIEIKEIKKGVEKNATYYVEDFTKIVMWRNKVQ